MVGVGRDPDVGDPPGPVDVGEVEGLARRDVDARRDLPARRRGRGRRRRPCPPSHDPRRPAAPSKFSGEIDRVCTIASARGRYESGCAIGALRASGPVLNRFQPRLHTVAAGSHRARAATGRPWPRSMRSRSSPACRPRPCRACSTASACPLRRNGACARPRTELSFTPNRTARTLRRRRSEVIALVIPDIENPYFTELARGVEDVAPRPGTRSCCATRTRSREGGRPTSRSRVRAHGGGDPGRRRRTRATRARSSRRAVPSSPSTARTGLDVDAVMIDNRNGGQAATRALLDRLPRIACITGPAHRDRAGARARAGAMRSRPQAGATPRVAAPRQLPRRRRPGGDGGAAGAAPSRPDAVVAANNLMGVGALQVLHERAHPARRSGSRSSATCRSPRSRHPGP